MPTDVLVGIALFGALLTGALGVHLIEWPLYSNTRLERNQLAADLASMTTKCESWHSVAERALLVAQLAGKVTARATKFATVTDLQHGDV